MRLSLLLLLLLEVSTLWIWGRRRERKEERGPYFTSSSLGRRQRPPLSKRIFEVIGFHTPFSFCSGCCERKEGHRPKEERETHE